MRIVSLFVCAVAWAVLSVAAQAETAASATESASAAPAAREGAAPKEAPSAAQPSAASQETPPATAAPPPTPKRKPVLGPVGHDASGQRGRIHTVASGDTLWDVSEAYLGTPWVWPSIWQDNPEVPNPHRIFPGDKLWISPTSMRRVTDAEAAALLAGEAGETPPAATDDAVATPLDALSASTLGGVGFVAADVLEAAGSVLGSSRAERMYQQDMPVYISLGEGQVRQSDRFDVARVDDEVRDPESGREIGVHVNYVGWIEVTKVHGESSEAIIRLSSEEIQAGDRILPRIEPETQISLRPATASVEGQLAYFPHLRTVMAGNDFVFLNRGSEHGLAAGSPLEVYRSLGEARDEETGARRLLPDDVVGHLVVVTAEPTTAVAVVLHAREELARGDHFRAAQ